MPFPQSRPPTWVASPLLLPVPESPPLSSRLHWACYPQRPPLPHLLDDLHTPTPTFPGRRAQASLRPVANPASEARSSGGGWPGGLWKEPHVSQAGQQVKAPTPSRSPCAPSCWARWTAAHAHTLDSAAAWCFDVALGRPEGRGGPGSRSASPGSGEPENAQGGGLSPLVLHPTHGKGPRKSLSASPGHVGGGTPAAAGV